VNVGQLGADYEADAASGMYRIKKIFTGENWDAHTRSPLTEPGVNIKEGDYLMAINGRALRTPQTPDELLVNTANEVVTLTVNSKPAADGARKVVVKPIGDEYNLRELNMIETNRKKVDAASGGRIGYVYLPNMGDEGTERVRQAVLPADSQGRNHLRCALQRRRLRGPAYF
jgi:tricorn protease